MCGILRAYCDNVIPTNVSYTVLLVIYFDYLDYFQSMINFFYHNIYPLLAVSCPDDFIQHPTKEICLKFFDDEADHGYVQAAYQ